MCGIAGILRVYSPEGAPPRHEDSIPEAWLDILDESIRHRGPDGAGRFRDRARRDDGRIVDVALVHRRLSIIDHEGGHQPMVLGAAGFTPADLGRLPPAAAQAYRATAAHTIPRCPRCEAQGLSTTAVVFNGCIYNHRELRRTLEANRHQFGTDHSDTEVLLHGWSEWRTEWPAGNRLDGMYAAAIWDRQRATLALIRDPRGEKPMYFTPPDTGRAAVFASSPGAIANVLRAAAQPLNPDRPSLRRWIRFGHDPTSTPFMGLWQLAAGGTAWLPEGRTPGSGWPGQVSQARPRASAMSATDPGEIVDLFDGLLSTAVASRLEADVPVGCLLSGGVDSSLVTALASRTTSALVAITVRMPSAALDESAIASRIAAHLGVRHIVADVATDPAEDLRRQVAGLGLPFGDSSLLPTFWAARAARELVRVVLTGDGGDELFLGYERHLAARWMGGRRALMRALPTSFLPRRNPRSLGSKAARLAAAARGSGYADLVSIFPTAEARMLLGAAPVDDGSLGAATALDAGRCDLTFSLPGDMLRKVDTATMSVALESRAPILAPRVAEAALSLGEADLMPGGVRKGLLRAVARRYIPSEIIDRPKMGFAIPIGDWFRTDYGGMRRLLLDHLQGPEPFGPEHLGIGPMINMGCVRRMLREHDAAGERSVWPWKGRDHSQRLYMLLVLSIWAKWLGSL